VWQSSQFLLRSLAKKIDKFGPRKMRLTLSMNRIRFERDEGEGESDFLFL